MYLIDTVNITSAFVLPFPRSEFDARKDINMNTELKQTKHAINQLCRICSNQQQNDNQFMQINWPVILNNLPPINQF